MRRREKGSAERERGSVKVQANQAKGGEGRPVTPEMKGERDASTHEVRVDEGSRRNADACIARRACVQSQAGTPGSAGEAASSCMTSEKVTANAREREREAD